MAFRMSQLMVAVVLIGTGLAVQGCGLGRAGSGPSVTVDSSAPDLSWTPPTDGFDWIQLKSGEWLKGQMKAVQNRQIEFESEELDTLTFDWKDIRQLRSHSILNALFEDDTEASGFVTVTPGEVRMGGAEPVVFHREELQSLTAGGSRERNYWSGRGTLGLALRGGNTKAVEYNAQARLQRCTPGTRFVLDYNGNVSSTDGRENANNNRMSSEFDLDVSFVWNRTSQPKPDENGVVPKPDDFQLILGVGIDV